MTHNRAGGRPIDSPSRLFSFRPVGPHAKSALEIDHAQMRPDDIQSHILRLSGQSAMSNIQHGAYMGRIKSLNKVHDPDRTADKPVAVVLHTDFDPCRSKAGTSFS